MKNTTSYSLYETYIQDAYGKDEHSISNNGNLFSNFGSGELSYAVDSLNLIRFSIGGYHDNMDMDYSGYYFEHNHQNKITEQSNTSSSKSNTNSILGSIDYQRYVKNPNKQLTVSYMMDCKPSNTYSEGVYHSLSNNNSDLVVQNKNINDSYENSIQVDFTNPITVNHQYELGAKYSILSNQIENNTYNIEAATNSRVQYPRMSKDLTYTHNMVSAYGDYCLNWKRVLFKTGLRYEGVNTSSKLSQEMKTLKYDKSISAIVPYLTLAYQLRKSSSVKICYIQRLKQPDVWLQIPYIDNSDASQITQGNPNPKYEKEHRFDLTYTYNGRRNAIMEANIFFLKNNDIFQGYSILYYDGVTYSYPSTRSYNSFGTNVYGSYCPIPNVCISINGSAFYLTSKRSSVLGDPFKNEGWAYYGSGSIQWTIKQGLVLSGFVAGYSKVMQEDIELRGYTYSSFSLCKNLLNNKMSLSVSVHNPFRKSLIWKDEKSEPDFFYSYNKCSIQDRTISFGISYRFGKTEQAVKKAQRGISNDDVKANNSNDRNHGSGK
jgi:hypothetical protein